MSNVDSPLAPDPHEIDSPRPHSRDASPADVPEDLAIGAGSGSARVATTRKCHFCRSVLNQNAVISIQCGYDLRTKRPVKPSSVWKTRSTAPQKRNAIEPLAKYFRQISWSKAKFSLAMLPTEPLLFYGAALSTSMIRSAGGQTNFLPVAIIGIPLFLLSPVFALAHFVHSLKFFTLQLFRSALFLLLFLSSRDAYSQVDLPPAKATSLDESMGLLTLYVDIDRREDNPFTGPIDGAPHETSEYIVPRLLIRIDRVNDDFLTFLTPHLLVIEPSHLVLNTGDDIGEFRASPQHRLTNEGLAPLSNLISLESIEIGVASDLTVDRLTSDAFQHFAKLNNLHSVNVKNTPIRPLALQHLTLKAPRSVEMQDFKYSHNIYGSTQITESVTISIGEINSLEEWSAVSAFIANHAPKNCEVNLTLHMSPTDQVLELLGQATQISEIYVQPHAKEFAGSQTSDGLRSLAPMSRLKRVSLDHPISGFRHLMELNDLRSVSLREFSLTLDENTISVSVYREWPAADLRMVSEYLKQRSAETGLRVIISGNRNQARSTIDQLRSSLASVLAEEKTP